MNDRERRAELLVALCFGATILGAGALFVVYFLGGQAQLEGLLLLVTLGGLGMGISIWARDLLPHREIVEDRHRLGSDPEARRQVEDAITDEAGISRRVLLVRLLLGGLGALAAALAIPVLSLGPSPGKSLFETAWRRGLRLVDEEGRPVRAEDLDVGSLATVFPEGAGHPADSATVLIRVEPDLLRLPPDQAAYAPDGYVAYSKLCTHAGCPVGLYLAERHELACPCHQSVFDVLDGAKPLAGPAARPLPQLPIQRQADGTFIALGDFPAPVGPSFWSVNQ
jgi:ubiquinol-cytochrome c reductase iron-sulfur subunit